MSVFPPQLQRLLRAGAHLESDARDQRRIDVNNSIALTLALNTGMYVVVLCAMGLRPLGLLLIPLGACYLLPIWFNHLGRFVTSRVVLVTIPSAIVFTYVSAIGLRGEVSLFFAAASLPLVVCDLRERAVIVWGIGLAVAGALVMAIGGGSLMGVHLLSPSAEFTLRVILIVGTFGILLAIVLSFVVSNARAEGSLRVAHGDILRVLAERERSEEKQRALQLELAQAQKLESVGRLAAGVAHEINTPIQYVGDSIHFVREGIDDLRGLIESYQHLARAVANGSASPEDVQRIAGAEEEADLAYLLENVPKALDRAIDGVGRVAAIVRSMKEFAHPDGPEKSSADLNRALLSTLTISRNAYKSVADVDTQLKEIPPVLCHLGSLNQVFLNLIVNAADSIGEVVSGSERKGRITISTREEKETESVLISVGDDGAGIPEDIKDQDLRSIFHHQIGWQGNRSGSRDHKEDCRHARRRDLVRQRGGKRNDVLHPPPVRGAIGVHRPHLPLKAEGVSSDTCRVIGEE